MWVPVPQVDPFSGIQALGSGLGAGLESGLGHQASADSHLVAGQQVLTCFQVWAGLAHEDVTLASDRPDGLRGRASMDLPALAAGQAEQGELAWVYNMGHLPGRLRLGWSFLTKSSRIPDHSPSHSYLALWRQPGVRATSVSSSRGYRGQRSVWLH